MKKSIVKIIGILAVLSLLCGAIFAMSISTNAAGPSTITINGVVVSNGQYLQEGSNTPTTTKPTSNYAQFNNGILSLNNFDIADATQNGIYYNGDLTVELTGRNSISTSKIGVQANNNITIRGSGTLTVNSSGTCISSVQGSIAFTGGDLYLTSTGGKGVYCTGNINFNDADIVEISAATYGIECQRLNVNNVETLLVTSGSSYKAFYVPAMTISNALAASGSQTNDGNNAYALTSSNYGLAKYAYIRQWIDLYVGGIPMGIGEYLHQSWGAASTYKPKDNYAMVDLNGDTDELYLKNFNLNTNGVTAITTGSSLKLHLAGISSINSASGDAICINKGSLSVISGGTLNINTTSGMGINIKDGNYTHGGYAVINITSTAASGVLASNKNITINSGELNVTASYIGISAHNFTITGGKVDTRSTNNQTNNALHFGIINYGSLTAMAASTADGPLVPFTNAHKNANKRVLITSHICTGEYVASIPSSCTAQGKMAYYKCSCGKFYEDANCSKIISNINTWGIISAKDHTPIAGWKTDGTYHWKTCTKCNIAEIPNTKVKHSGGEATCSTKAMCDICKAYYGATGTHKWSSNWNYTLPEGHAHLCIYENCNQHSAIEKHIPDIAAPTEAQAQKCKLCNYVIAPALGHVCKNHVFKVDYHGATCIDYGNIEYYECTCGKYYKNSNATQEITDKNSVRIPKTAHTYLDNWYSDANGHWQQCDCMKKGNIETHKDDNNDYFCDICSYALPKSADSNTPEGTTDPTNPIDPANPTDPGDSTSQGDPATQPTTNDPSKDGTSTTEPTTPAGNGEGNGINWLALLIIVIIIVVIITMICGTAIIIALILKKKKSA